MAKKPMMPPPEIHEKYKAKPGSRPGGRGHGPGGRGRPMEKPKDAIGTTKRILKYLHGYEWQLAIVALTLVVTAVMGPASLLKNE